MPKDEHYVAVHIRLPRDLYERLLRKQKAMTAMAKAEVTFAAAMRAVLEEAVR